MHSNKHTVIILFLILVLSFTGYWIFYINSRENIAKQANRTSAQNTFDLSELTLEKVSYTTPCQTGCHKQIKVDIEGIGPSKFKKTYYTTNEEELSCTFSSDRWHWAQVSFNRHIRSNKFYEPLPMIIDSSNELALLCSDNRGDAADCMNVIVSNGDTYQIIDPIYDSTKDPVLGCAFPTLCPNTSSKFFKLSESGAIEERYFYVYENRSSVDDIRDLIGDIAAEKEDCKEK